MIDRAIVVTRKTRLEELIARFNTKAQAKFYIEQAGANFVEYELEHATYQLAIDNITSELETRLKVQVIDRSFVPSFLFPPDVLIVTVGQDGLVANTAKYVGGRPIVAINPDPVRFDGLLLPFLASDFFSAGVEAVVRGSPSVRTVTMAEAKLQDGQRLLAFNDFFVGANSHVSARYAIRHRRESEEHSSSGVLISTGAGSTGWMSSVFNMTRGVAQRFGAPTTLSLKMSWETERLVFVVREPFVSRTSGARLVAGEIDAASPLVIESHMPKGGVVFSDGVEHDFMLFNSGAIVSIGIAPEVARLVVTTGTRAKTTTVSAAPQKVRRGRRSVGFSPN
jgi:NAD kinase